MSWCGAVHLLYIPKLLISMCFVSFLSSCCPRTVFCWLLLKQEEILPTFYTNPQLATAADGSLLLFVIGMPCNHTADCTNSSAPPGPANKYTCEPHTDMQDGISMLSSSNGPLGPWTNHGRVLSGEPRPTDYYPFAFFCLLYRPMFVFALSVECMLPACVRSASSALQIQCSPR